MFRHARRLLARDTRAIAAAGLAAAAVWSATAIPTPAHEGHDHGEAPRAAPMPGSPRVVATSERYQLVGIAEGEVLVLYLDRADDNAPVTAAALEVSLDGQPFKVYKFRSMPIDAESSSGPIWAREDDPRATRIGRWLRRTDVDELPQFWNVLKGDMSIVGPRPERPFFVEQFKHRIPQYMLRHKVKAGITGWAQVNGWRGNTSLEKRIEYDLYYIENWSVSLDIKIMCLTLLRGLQKHAY